MDIDKGKENESKYLAASAVELVSYVQRLCIYLYIRMHVMNIRFFLLNYVSMRGCAPSAFRCHGCTE